MEVRFWGTRGSIATPGPHTVRFGGNGLRKTDLGITTLHFKLNKYVTFVDELSYWDTRAATVKLFRGLPALTAHSWRNEVGPVFVF